MKKFFLINATLCVSLTANAADLPTFEKIPEPVFFEDMLDGSQGVKQAWEETVVPTTPSTELPQANLAGISETDLQEINLLYAEDLIGQAVIYQEWEILQELLDIYQQMPEFDGILVDYAKGAMLRKQGQQKEAIAKYQGILDHRDDLPYVKLDLALMLFEDKQYHQAQKLLDQLMAQQNLSVNTQAIIKNVQQTIKKSQAWQPSVSLNYESTDNVNNASSERELVWLGRRWQKQEDSLPQSAHGIRYDVGVSKDTNISGNHYTVVDVGVDGVHYFDKSEYDETTARLAAGYKYHDIDRSWRVIPFVEQNWLNNDKYNSSIGVTGSYGQNVGDKDYWQVYGSYSQKRYDNDRIAQNYDGHLTSLGTALNHRINGQSLVYGGLDVVLDDTQNPEYASVRYGVRTGLVHTFDNGLGFNGNVRYARRQFDAPSTLVYDFVRRDDEYQAGLSVWHKKLSWYGFRPQANIRYVKIDSNMPAFYSREGLSYFMNVEKAF